MPARATTRCLTTIPKCRSTAGGRAPIRCCCGAVTTVNLGNLDQTSGVTRSLSTISQNVDASALSSGISITGSAGREYTDPAAAAMIRSTAPAARTRSIAGCRQRHRHVSTERRRRSMVGLVRIRWSSPAAPRLAVSTSQWPAGADQTTGDSSLIKNFENLDASVATSGLTVTGSSAAKHHYEPAPAKRYDRWRRRRGRDQCQRRPTTPSPTMDPKTSSTAAPAATRCCSRP